jgi:gamma-glutamylcyclotransferase (GGCT)/AIG2-like uncharacterized protein YtfP
MNELSHLLFVYGSLRSGFHHPAYEYISHYFTLVSPAKINGSMFDLGEYPAAIPDQHSNRKIIGELYRINEIDEFGWAIAQLDDYEGLYTEAEEIPLFRRELVTVYWEDKQDRAWVYWYNGDVSGHPLIESGDVLEYKIQKENRGTA